MQQPPQQQWNQPPDQWGQPPQYAPAPTTAATEPVGTATTIRTTAATEPVGTVTTIRTTAVMEPAPAVTEPMGSTLTMEPAGTSRMATATCWTEQAETCLEAPGGFLWRDRPRVALLRDRHLLCPATCLSHLRERYASPAGPAAHPCCALHGDRRRVYHCRPRHASHIFALKVLCEEVRNPAQRFQFFQEEVLVQVGIALLRSRLLVSVQAQPGAARSGLLQKCHHFLNSLSAFSSESCEGRWLSFAFTGHSD